MLARGIERLLLIAGTVMLVAYIAVKVDAAVSSQWALHRFYVVHASDSGANQKSSGQRAEPVDFTLWDSNRIEAYRESQLSGEDLPLAILRIPKIHLEVPVFDGTDDPTLNRGVGRIVGTARIGQRGNIGIAGHRDGFFRGLKDIAQGDTVELVTPGKTIRYVIQKTMVVQPEDVSVLATQPVPTLTLVTCFPFYFVGSAPQRFIVQASSPSFDDVDRSGRKSTDQTNTKENSK
jgi:sortase A